MSIVAAGLAPLKRRSAFVVLQYNFKLAPRTINYWKWYYKLIRLRFLGTSNRLAFRRPQSLAHRRPRLQRFAWYFESDQFQILFPFHHRYQLFTLNLYQHLFCRYLQRSFPHRYLQHARHETRFRLGLQF